MVDASRDPLRAAPRATSRILIAAWRFAGDQGDHNIKVITQAPGPSKLEAWVDGRLLAVADAPQPPLARTTLDVGVIDGREVLANVETTDGGATFRCDVLVGGVSLSAVAADELAARQLAARLAALARPRSAPHLPKGRLQRAFAYCLIAAVVLVGLLIALWLYVIWLVANNPPGY